MSSKLLFIVQPLYHTRCPFSRDSHTKARKNVQIEGRHTLSKGRHKKFQGRHLALKLAANYKHSREHIAHGCVCTLIMITIKPIGLCEPQSGDNFGDALK